MLLEKIVRVVASMAPMIHMALMAPITLITLMAIIVLVVLLALMVLLVHLARVVLTVRMARMGPICLQSPTHSYGSYGSSREKNFGS